MTPDAAPSWCASVWAAMQAMRNLGFSADELFFAADEFPHGQIFVGVALVRGESKFGWSVDHLKGSSANPLGPRWQAFVVEMKRVSEPELDAMWKIGLANLERNGVFPGYLKLAQAIRKKGFEVPALEDALKKLDELEAKRS